MDSIFASGPSCPGFSEKKYCFGHWKALLSWSYPSSGMVVLQKIGQNERIMGYDPQVTRLSCYSTTRDTIYRLLNLPWRHMQESRNVWPFSSGGPRTRTCGARASVISTSTCCAGTRRRTCRGRSLTSSISTSSTSPSSTTPTPSTPTSSETLWNESFLGENFVRHSSYKPTLRKSYLKLGSWSWLHLSAKPRFKPMLAPRICQGDLESIIETFKSKIL